METKVLTYWLCPLIILFLICAVFTSGSWAKEAKPKKEAPPEAITTEHLDVPVDELELLLKPLTTDELVIEADAWLKIVKTKVEEVSAAEIAVKQKNREIEKAVELQKEIEVAQVALDEVKEAAQKAETDTTGAAAKEALAGAEKAQQAAESVEEKLDEAQNLTDHDTVQKALDATGVKDPSQGKQIVSAETVKAAQEAQDATEEVTKVAKETQIAVTQKGNTEQAQKAKMIATTAEDAQQALHATGEAVKVEVDQSSEKLAKKVGGDNDAEVKTRILDAVADLRAERIALVDRFNIVLDELSTKLGKTPEGKDNETVVPYRLYGNSVGGIKVDVSDKEAALATITGWIKSDEGGIRWAKNILVFIVTVVAFWILGRILGRLAEKAFRIAKNTSILLRNFIVHSVRRVTLIIGLIIGLTSLEVNIGPLLAMIGAAGFIVAFALQNTLSNFASGIMIMLYKPFDVGNLVDVSGVMGVVRSMNLVTTTITSADNKVMVVPNNSIWGNIITNITGSEQRRVDMVFGIGYSDDISQAHQVLSELVADHPLVLDSPETTIQVHELAESSVNLICRPWAKTDDYWTVYWDLTRKVKERFDAEGISFPFPQRDLHILNESQKV